MVVSSMLNESTVGSAQPEAGASADNRGGTVRVVHGPNDRQFDLHGKKVEAVRKSLKYDFNLPVDAQCLIAGSPVSDERVIQAGETLEFFLPFGMKGIGALLTREQLIELWGITAQDYEELLIIGLPLLRLSDGGIRHSECSVDEFFRHLGNPDREPAPELVGTPYVADRLGVTGTWVAQMIKRKEIPPGCIVPGSGDGKPWKLFRVRIDEWLKRR